MSVRTASQVNTHLDDVTAQVSDDVTAQVSDDVMCAGSFCEQIVCLKKGGCLDDAEGSSSSLTSHLYLLTLSLMSSTFC